MYKIFYTKLAIGKDFSVGNVSQGQDVAYMDCEFEDLGPRLKLYLRDKAQGGKFFPVIDNVAKIKGHIVT